MTILTREQVAQLGEIELSDGTKTTGAQIIQESTKPQEAMLTPEEMATFHKIYGLDKQPGYVSPIPTQETKQEPKFRGQYSTSTGTDPSELIEKVKAGETQRGITGVGVGAAKGVARLGQGLGELGTKVLENTARPLANALLPEDKEISKEEFRSDFTAQEYVKGTPEFESFQEATKPRGGAESLGFTAEKIGEFFLGSGVVKGATAGAKLPAVVANAPKIVRTGAKALGRITRDVLADVGVSLINEGGEFTGNTANTAKTTAILSALPKSVEVFAETGPGKALQKFLVETIPSRSMGRIIKANAKDFDFGKNPGLAVAQEGIKANTRAGVLEGIEKRLDDIGSRMDQIAESKKGITVNVKDKVTAPIAKAKSEALKSGDKALYQRLIDLEESLTKDLAEEVTEQGVKVVQTGEKNLDLDLPQLLALKRQVGRNARWTGQLFDADINKVRREIYSNLRKSSEELAPEMRTLNERYGNLLTAEKALDKAIKVKERQNIIGLQSLILAGVGTVSGVGGGAEDPVEAIMPGIALAIGGRAAASPAVTTRYSSILSKSFQDVPDKKKREIMAAIADVVNGIRQNRDAQEEGEQ